MLNLGPTLSIQSGSGTGPIELTIISPCRNERPNIRPLVAKLHESLAGIEWEVVFVDDDSSDGTADEVRAVAQEDRRVRCLQRIGRSGLSTAVVEGMLSSSAQYLAVIDADMQHDERLLPTMLEALRSQDYDIAVGSRYIDGGTVGTWDRKRAKLSALATQLARLVMKHEVSDPMSGFFMITRRGFESSVRNVSGFGFKILLDLFASAPRPLRVKELGYEFRSRQYGESKLDSMVMIEYVLLLIDKFLGGLIPPRFILFAAVGTLGVAVHLALLRLQLRHFDFLTSQAIATIAAMTFNFVLNNVLTYRDHRLRGSQLVWGLITFYAVCSIGALANVGVAANLYKEHYSWLTSGLAGILVGVVWNYAMSAAFTWRKA